MITLIEGKKSPPIRFEGGGGCKKNEPGSPFDVCKHGSMQTAVTAASSSAVAPPKCNVFGRPPRVSRVGTCHAATCSMRFHFMWNTLNKGKKQGKTRGGGQIGVAEWDPPGIPEKKGGDFLSNCKIKIPRPAQINSITYEANRGGWRGGRDLRKITAVRA